MTASTSPPTAPSTGRTDPRVHAFHRALAAFPAATFQFDSRMRDGWYSDRYFVRTARTLAMSGRDPIVTMQIFAKQYGVVAGIYEAIRMLETQLAPPGTRAREAGWHEFAIEALMDGDAIAPFETVMLITGPYRRYAHLETGYLGVLSRRSLIASNVRRVIDAAGGKPVIFMGARHDDWRVQTPDGYAARVGGAGAVSSHAGGAWWGATGVGTMPHAMIAAFDGDAVAATLAFARYCREKEPGMAVVSLVDYHNDAVRDALAVARAMHAMFGSGGLAAVRLDTAEGLVDAALAEDAARRGPEGLLGVNPLLVHRVRDALNQGGFSDVGIVVSGGFTPARIRRFEKDGVPVTGYGIGSSLLGHNDGVIDGLLTHCDFTADVVRVNGHPQSKTGRGYSPNPRLIPLDFALLRELEEVRAKHEESRPRAADGEDVPKQGGLASGEGNS